MTKLKVFEAFAGIGAQHKALNNMNKPYEVIGLAEWFVPAILAYHAIHDDVPILNATESAMREYLESRTLSMDSKTPVSKGYWNRVKGDELRTICSYVKHSDEMGNIFDITTLTESGVRGIDLLTYSFPCQDISAQGKGAGIKEGTRSGLLLEIERYIRSLSDNELPKYLLLENVKALINENHIEDFKKWLAYLETRGYITDWKVLNSKDFGSPQSRERVFALSSREEFVDLPTRNEKPRKVLNDIMDKHFDEEYRLEKLENCERTPWQEDRGTNFIKGFSLVGVYTFETDARVYDPYHVGSTLLAGGSHDKIKLLYGDKIYCMSPKEMYRYMGFTTEDFEKVNNLKILSKSNLIYTAGNSISVEVLEGIFDRLKYEKDIKETQEESNWPSMENSLVKNLKSLEEISYNFIHHLVLTDQFENMKAKRETLKSQNKPLDVSTSEARTLLWKVKNTISIELLRKGKE